MKTLKERMEALVGITKIEWNTLKYVIDEGFARKQKEIDASVRISQEEMAAIIRSTFPKGR